MNIYTYRVAGTNVDGNTWSHEGELMCKPGDFTVLPMHALKSSFDALTQGRAVFSKPGVGCSGPYNITELHIVPKGRVA